MKFGTGIDLDNILDKFEGQGHRSKVKVIQIKNVIFRVLAWVLCVINGIKISCACVHRNFVHVHARNLGMRMRRIDHEICARAQIGPARGRCSNTLVFFYSMEMTWKHTKKGFYLSFINMKEWVEKNLCLKPICVGKQENP